MMEESSFRGCGEMEADIVDRGSREAQVEETGLKSRLGRG